MLLHDYLIQSAARFPNKTALVCSHSTYTYAQVDRAARGFAAYLLDHGLSKGDRVALYLENTPEAVMAMFGTLFAGGCCVPLDAEVPLSKVRFLLEHSGAKFLVAPGSKILSLRDATAGMASPPGFVWVGAGEDLGTTFHAISKGTGPERFPGVIDLDLSFIIYTSGSTGKPKGVTHTHRSVDCVVNSVAAYLTSTPDDVVLCVLPVHLSYGLLQVFGTFFAGGTLVLERGHATPHDIVRLIQEYGVTGFAGTPTIWALMLTAASGGESQKAGVSDLLGRGALKSVRYVTNASDALPVSFVPKLRHLLPGAKIYLMHGQTECLRTSYLPPEEMRSRPGSVGSGMDIVQLWLEDEDGRHVQAGGVGELVVRGSNLMLGYWNDPEATSKVLLPGPYPGERVLHTGDLFRMDAEGYFYFVSRKDEIIKSRGQKVSPVEVESILYQLDEVAECRVLGAADEVLGQAVRAEVVIRPGKDFDEKRLRGHCALHLEPYKIPTVFVMVPEIPKTAAGKIRRESI